jgi:hypothetical protein
VHPRARPVRGALLLAGALLLVAACGDEDNRNRVLDVATAEVIAAESLLIESDLPRAPWLVIEQDEFGEPEDLAGEFLQAPECESLMRIVQGSGWGEVEPLATASRGFQAEQGLFAVHLATSVVHVFETVDHATEAHELVSEVITGDELRQCFTEGFSDLEQEGIEVRGIEIRDPTAAIEGSAGISAEIEVFALILTLESQLHLHVFQREHTVATLVVLEMNSQLLTTAQQALLEALDARVTVALEGNE